jgi:hypothetical protein
MHYRFLMPCLLLIFYQLAAEKESSESPSIIVLDVKLSVPLSFYTDSWNPKEKLPTALPGIRIEEKDLVVDLDKAIKKSREEQDLMRIQNCSLFDTNYWSSPIELKEEIDERTITREMQE